MHADGDVVGETTAARLSVLTEALVTTNDTTREIGGGILDRLLKFSRGTFTDPVHTIGIPIPIRK